MDVEYKNKINRMLTSNGFGPQLQGVHVDWEGLDRTLREHYGTILVPPAPPEQAKEPDPAPTPKPEIPAAARTRKPRGGKKAGGDDGMNGDDGDSAGG